ncbi:MAG TPA: 7-cyano-7-deazaguanine synthase QueC [Gammaproteobacteria bacterium]|nr:7-cyano-7-deazaguanine synthase QueC [Gammaproteobacteria bacterium]
MSHRKAVILLSGGLDSTTVLAIAREQGFACHALSFDYGQRHSTELSAAMSIAQQLGAVEHKTIRIGLGTIGGSALTDASLKIPETPGEGIPNTYVPARNTMFLSLALGYAEVIGSFDIFAGVTAVDYSGYPDCRPEFIAAFEQLANVATKAAIEGAGRFRIHTPLIQMSKAEIIQAGHRLGIDYAQTVSCYQADNRRRACGVCDSCRLRAKGFAEAGLPDPTLYQSENPAPAQ